MRVCIQFLVCAPFPTVIDAIVCLIASFLFSQYSLFRSTLSQYFTLPHVSYRTIRSPDGSQIVTWTVRRTPLDSTGVTVDPDGSQIVTWSVRWTPLDCAGLDSSGVKNGSRVQRGGSSGFRRTVPDWSDKMAVESREGGPVDSAGLCWTGVTK